MNVVITLPIDLINHIVEGRKTIEVRKSFPKRFDISKDWVYVAEAGSKRLMIAFQVDHVMESALYAEIWRKYGKQISAPYLWYQKYNRDGKVLKLWFIKNVRLFRQGDKAYYLGGIKRNPQMYEYTTAEFYESSLKCLPERKEDARNV